MIRENFLKKKLENGQTCLGTWSIIPSTINSDIISSTNIDFIIIDQEHGPINFETAQNMVIACENNKVSPLIRTGGVEESSLLRALDIGCHGIQVPNINTVSQIKNLINYTKYPPEGNRGFSPFTRAGNYSIENAKQITNIANDNTLLGINVEGEEGIQNIDQFLEFKTLDLIFIGLFDISKSLGIPGDVKNKKVKKYLSELSKKINNQKKYPGTIATTIDDLKYYIDIGIKYILYLVDCEILRKSYSDVVIEFEKIKNV